MHPLRIALAEDEPEIRDYFREILERLGHSVVVNVDNGLSLVEECRRTPHDLIITDVRMPLLDGDAAVQQLWETSTVPAILISAYSSPVLSTSGPTCYSYLNKPVRRADLEAAIERLVSTSDSD